MRYILASIILLSCNKSSTPLPDTTYKKIHCCGELFTALEIDDNKALTIDLKESNLNLNTSPQVYKLEDHPGDIIVKYYTHANHPDSAYYDFCTDAIRLPYGRRTIWTAVSGSLTAAVSKPKAQRQRCEDYYASVQLLNLRLTNGTIDTTITAMRVNYKLYNACIPQPPDYFSSE